MTIASFFVAVVTVFIALASVRYTRVQVAQAGKARPLSRSAGTLSWPLSWI
jgi:hypothetical protein